MSGNSSLDFNTVPDHELFFYMSCKEEEPEIANEAFRTFYNRYKNYTFSICRDLFLSRGRTDSEDLKSFFHNVFLNIYLKSKEIAISESVPEDEKRIVICGMIGKFVHYEGLTYMKVKSNESLEITYVEEFNENIKENETYEVQSVESKLLDKALNSLPKKTKLILLELFRFDENDKNTPSEVLDELCEYFDTTRPSLRQTKLRALKKVREYIEQTEKMKVLK